MSGIARNRLQVPRTSSKMASSVNRNANSAKPFVRPGTKKTLEINKIKDLSSKEMSPKATINVGMSSCPKCDIIDKSNMVECICCLRWYHYTCVSLDYEFLQLYVKRKETFPYMCKDCITFARTYFGKVLLNDIIPKTVFRVSQIDEEVSLLECRMKVVEQQNRYDENSEFQEAVNKQIEKYIDSIKTDLKEMEEKFEKVSCEIKTDVDNSYNRRKRVVVFGMPNTQNDLEAVQLLSEELEIDLTNIKKIFRLNSPCNNSIAPPINIEFYSMDDKWKLLNKNTREKLRNLSDNSQFHGVSVAPDRSFRERQKYCQMRTEMNQRNTQLLNNGISDKVWIIRKMCLEKVEVKPDEA